MLRRSPGLASSMAISSVYFPLALCWLHPPMVWAVIGLECVKRLPPSRPWSPQRHLRRPCCSRGGSGIAPDCFGTDGHPRQPAGHLLVCNIPRKSLESYGTDFQGWNMQSLVPKPDMLRDLNNRGITIAAEKMSARLGMPHHAPLEGLRMTGKHVGTIDLPSRLAASSKAARSSRLFRGSRSC